MPLVKISLRKLTCLFGALLFLCLSSDVVISKATTVAITFEVGKVKFLDLPDYYEPGEVISGKASKRSSLIAEGFTLVPFLKFSLSQQISVCHFNGTPIANKAVYLLDGNSWPKKLLLNLTTNQKGVAKFSLNTVKLAKAALNLVVRFVF